MNDLEGQIVRLRTLVLVLARTIPKDVWQTFAPSTDRAWLAVQHDQDQAFIHHATGWTVRADTVRDDGWRVEERYGGQLTGRLTGLILHKDQADVVARELNLHAQWEHRAEHLK